MKPTKHWHRRLAVTLIVMLSSACSTLQVDVDVYKGPLANHKTIQTQQFAALANSTKSLIVGMRREYLYQFNKESAKRGGQKLWLFDEQGYDQTLSKLSAQRDLLGDAIHTPTFKAIYELNDALSFFDDRIDSAVDDQLQLVIRDQQRYTNRRSRLDQVPDNLPDGREGQAANESSTVKEKRDEFGIGLMRWLKRDTGRQHAKSALDAVFDSCRQALDQVKGLCPKHSRSSDIHYALANNTFREAVVALFYPEPEQIVKRNRLNQILKDTSGALIGSIKSIEALWYSSLDLAESLRKSYDYGSSQTISRSSQQLDKAYWRAVEAISRMMSMLVSKPQLLCGTDYVIDKFQPQPAQYRSLKALHTAFRNIENEGAIWPQSISNDSQKISSELLRRLDRSFASLISKEFARLTMKEQSVHSSALVAAISEAGDLMKRYYRKAFDCSNRLYRHTDRTGNTSVKYFRAIASNNQPSHPSASGSRGVFRGPTLPPSQLQDLTYLIAQVTQSIGELYPTALTFGRQNAGIDRLADQLARIPPGERNSKHWNEINLQLENALIGFGEKIRVITTNRYILGDVDTADNQDAEDIKRSMDLLATVGNLIINQADEQAHRNAFDGQQQNRTQREFQAMRQAFQKSVPSSLTSIRLSIVARVEQLGARAAELSSGKAALSREETQLKNSQPESIKETETRAALYYLLSAQTPTGFASDLNAAFTRHASPKKTEVKSLRDIIAKDNELKGYWISGDIDETHKIRERLRQIVSASSTVKGAKELSVWLGTDQFEKVAGTKKGKEVKKNLTQHFKESLEAALKKQVSTDKRLAEIPAALTALNDQLDSLPDYAKTVAASGSTNTQNAHTTITQINKLFDTVVSAVTRRAEQLSASGHNEPVIFSILKEEMANVANNEAYKRAYPAIQAYTPKASLPLGTVEHKKDIYESPQDLLDQVIAQLSYQEIKARKEDRTTEALALQNAIEAARKRRADLAYLRPASAYLRNAIANTELQADPNLSWRNLLEDQFARTHGTASSARISRTREILSSLDKRSWTNINQVRVHGAGSANYALIKDDVGNWVTKSFSADPKEIFEAAKGLALFNIGGKAGINMLQGAKLFEELDNIPGSLSASQAAARRTEIHNQITELRDAGSPATAASENLVARFRESYQERTAKQVSQLRQLAQSQDFVTEIATKWTSILGDKEENAENRQPFLDLVKPESDILSSMKEALPETIDPQVQGLAIVKALTALIQAGNTLKDKASALNPAKTEQEAKTLAEAALEKETEALQQKQKERSQVVADLLALEPVVQTSNGGARTIKPNPEIASKKAEITVLDSEIATLDKAVDAAKKQLDTATSQHSAALGRKALIAKAVQEAVDSRVSEAVLIRKEMIDSFQRAILVLQEGLSPKKTEDKMKATADKPPTDSNQAPESTPVNPPATAPQALSSAPSLPIDAMHPPVIA